MYVKRDPLSFTQSRPKGRTLLTIRKLPGNGGYVLFIKQKSGKTVRLSMSQVDVNALCRFLDTHRTDISHGNIPTDEQVDVWLAKKGLKYAQSGCKEHGRRN